MPNPSIFSTPATGQRPIPADPRRWYALAVILLPILLNSLNTYMIQVALPSIQSSLNAGFADAQLIVTGFSLCLAVTLIVSGRLGDLYGRKRLLVIGVIGFTITALLGGLAPNPAYLIAVRCVQGAAAALIQPQVLSMMQVNFLLREKGLVFGLYGALMGFGFAFGLILGGVLVEWNGFGLGWRTVFLFNVPFGLIVLLCLPMIPESRGSRNSRIDWLGAALLIGGLLLLVYPLSEGQKQGWPLWIWGCLFLSVALLLVFIADGLRKQHRGESPLIDLSLFRRRTFRVGMISVVMIYLSMFSFFFVLSYYLQFGLHYGAQSAGLVFLPLGIGFFLTSLLSSRMVRRWGMNVLSLGALVTGLCCFGFILSLQADTAFMPSLSQTGILLVYGLGLGTVTTPLTGVVLAAVPPNDAGSASGMFATNMYLANSLGVAAVGILFSAALGRSLPAADLPDYVWAFSVSLAACGALAFVAFGCLIFLRDRGEAG
ncbi:MFS transporter [Paenibacillus ginsengarvi]|uniref:MFS transporter n=1 Tax=Paenibacillus ginsengarvi TaxID=400777 RepID=A0A3B0BEB9_9BACL|nr:MFS transporter [Paenibacillus ginsengarvi]RKN70668.1 MFS transporter [Paenibacillus ginsengarvi]